MGGRAGCPCNQAEKEDAKSGGRAAAKVEANNATLAGDPGADMGDGHDGNWPAANCICMSLAYSDAVAAAAASRC